jgi:hypothetical protein
MWRRTNLQVTSPVRLLVSFSLSLATFVALMPFARLDFDRHHDGYMLAQAIAIRDGLSAQSGVFGQYGPVTPWLQSWALELPLGPALSLRVFNSALIALTVFLIADIGRNRPNWSPITYQAGVFASVTWVLLADVWIGVKMLPWSSTVAAMLSVLFLYLFTRAKVSGLRGKPKTAMILSVLAGFSLGIMPFTRINVGILTLLAAAIGIFIIDRGTARPVKHLLPHMLLGAVFGAICVLGRLVAEGSLEAYIEQSIRWPLMWASPTLGSSRYVELAKVLFPQAIPVGAVLLVITLQLVHRNKWRRKVPLTLGIATMLSGILVVFVQNRDIVMDTTGPQWWINLVSPNFIFQYATYPNLGFLYFFLALMLVAGVLVVVVTMVERSRHRISTLRFGYWALIAMLALAGAYGVMPIYDTRHVWWGAPIGLLLIAALFGTVGSLIKPFRNPLLIPVLAVAIMATFSGVNLLLQPRIQSPASWVTAGMQLPETTAIHISEDLDLLKRYIGGGKEAIFLVPDGDVSVLLGSYQSVDPYFVEWPGFDGWAAVPNLSERIQGSPAVFIRGFDESVISPETLRALNGYQLADSNGRLMVFVPNSTSTPLDGD